MMFIGKLMIAVGTTGLFYVMITYVPQIKENILQPIYLLIVILFIYLDCVHYGSCYRHVIHVSVQFGNGYTIGLLYCR
jgi:hypothetical protein